MLARLETPAFGGPGHSWPGLGTIVLLGLVFSQAAGLPADCPAADLDPLGAEMTARYPAVTVPANTRQPGLNGRVQEGEYGPIAALQDLVTIMGDDKGVAGPHPTTVWIGRNPTALYVALRTEMPEGARPKITATEGRDTGQDADDAFEMFLVRGDRDGEQFHIALPPHAAVGGDHGRHAGLGRLEQGGKAARLGHPDPRFESAGGNDRRLQREPQAGCRGPGRRPARRPRAT